MKHKDISSHDGIIELLCIGSIENSHDLAFLETIVKKNKETILDFDSVDYINSCGFGALVESHLLFEKHQIKLSFKNIEPTIRKTIAYLGAEELLNLLD